MAIWTATIERKQRLQYMGGKARTSNQITEVILNTTTNRTKLIEPFIGGGWSTASLAPHFKTVEAYDIHEDLIVMWQALLDGSWEPPEETSREEYHEYKNMTEPSPMRGFLGFGLSFGGKWFGGYTGGGNAEEIAEKKTKKPNSQSDYISPARNGLLQKRNVMSNVMVANKSFFDIPVEPGVVLYCDPPYANTTSYRDSFNSGEFWERCDEWAEVSEVFVSEMEAPDDWDMVWERPVLRSLDVNNNAQLSVEKLFFKRPL